MNNRQSWTTGRMFFAALMSFHLLGYLAIIATYSEATISGKSFVIHAVVWAFRLLAGFMAIILGKLWKDKGFWLLMAYLLLKAVRITIPNPQHIFEESVSESILAGFWAFSACYGMAKVFNGRQLKQILRVNIAVWTVGMVIYSGIGIYAAWTEQWIYTIGEGAIWGINENRLFLSYYVTVSGAVLNVSAVVALCAAMAAKHKTNRILFLLSIIPMMIALGLTDSRGSQISSAAGMAFAVGIMTLTILSRHLQQKERKSWIAWPVALAAASVVFVTVVFACIETIPAFNCLRTQGLVIPRALAEDAGKTVLTTRGYNGENVLTLRPDIWKATIHVIKENPAILLWGNSILNPMKQVNALNYLPYPVGHAHCMPLMILLENGIPGVLLIGSFLLIAAKQVLRLFRNSGNRLPKLAVPVLVTISVLEMIECITLLRCSQFPILPVFFIVIGIIRFQTQTEMKNLAKQSYQIRSVHDPRKRGIPIP